MGGGQQVHVATVESEVEGYKQMSEAATLPLAEKKGKSKEKKPKEAKEKEKKTKSVTVVETSCNVGAPLEDFPLPPPEDTLLNLIMANRFVPIARSIIRIILSREKQKQSFPCF